MSRRADRFAFQARVRRGDKPAAFHDISEDRFPFTITAFASDGTVVWQQTVSEPGVLQVPGTGPGSVAYVRIEYADGEVVTSKEGS